MRVEWVGVVHSHSAAVVVGEGQGPRPVAAADAGERQRRLPFARCKDTERSGTESEQILVQFPDNKKIA